MFRLADFDLLLTDCLSHTQTTHLFHSTWVSSPLLPVIHRSRNTSNGVCVGVSGKGGGGGGLHPQVLFKNFFFFYNCLQFQNTKVCCYNLISYK